MTRLMHVDYEVSEQDFFEAQKLAIKKSPLAAVRMSRWVFPLAGVAAVIFLITAMAREGFRGNMVFGLLITSWLLFMPLIVRKTQKKLYARSKHFHGLMSLDADDYEMTIRGDGIDSRMAWSNFANSYEDDHSFVIYQSSAIFHPIPKRMLSEEQIAALRGCFERNIPAMA